MENRDPIEQLATMDELKYKYNDIKKDLDDVFKSELNNRKDDWYSYHDGQEFIDTKKAKEIVETISIKDELIRKIEITVESSRLHKSENNSSLKVYLELEKDGLMYRNNWHYSLVQNARNSKLDWLFDEE